MMKRSLAASVRTATALAVTAALGLSAVTAAPAAPAAEGPGPTITSVDMAAGAVESPGKPLTLHFVVHVSGHPDAPVKSVSIRAKGPDGAESVIVDVVKNPRNPDEWDGSGLLFNFELPGTHKVTIRAVDDNIDETDVTRTFKVYRGTHFTSFKAGPSPIRKGRLLTVSGQLNRLGGSGTWVPFAGQKVVVLFLKKGSHGPFVSKGTAISGKGGKFLKTFKAATTGFWSVEFFGAGSYFPTGTRTMTVTVR